MERKPTININQVKQVNISVGWFVSCFYTKTQWVVEYGKMVMHVVILVVS